MLKIEPLRFLQMFDYFKRPVGHAINGRYLIPHMLLLSYREHCLNIWLLFFGISLSLFAENLDLRSIISSINLKFWPNWKRCEGESCWCWSKNFGYVHKTFGEPLKCQQN